MEEERRGRNVADPAWRGGEGLGEREEVDFIASFSLLPSPPPPPSPPASIA